MTAGASVAAAGPPAHAPAESDVHEERAFGFWLYLMSDAIIFSLLFATYATMVHNTAGGPSGKTLFSLPNAFAETMLLLCSSITFGFASLAMKAGKTAGVLAWLIVTFALGLGFVGFLSAFFALVGTHGLHVSFGLVFILIMMSQVVIKGMTAPVASRFLRLGLFWHFLDIVWIGIFSVVYLPGVL